MPNILMIKLAQRSDSSKAALMMEYCHDGDLLRDRTEITFTVIEEKNGSDLDDFSDAGIRRSLLGKIVER